MGLAGTSSTAEEFPAFAEYVAHNGSKDRLWDEITQRDYTTRGRAAALEMVRKCNLTFDDQEIILSEPAPCDTCGMHRDLYKVIFTDKPILICDECIAK